MPTIKEVAEAAGVSVATVSYVLNGTKRVSPEVERRVRAVARHLNYQPNAAAQNLRRNETRIIGYELPVPRPGDVAAFMQQFAYGLTLVAAREGYHVITFSSHDAQHRLDAYKQLILSERVDGFVLSDTNWNDERVEFLLSHNFPFVAFGRTRPGKDFAYVDIDGFDGLKQVVEHLVSKGHQRIAFIGWPPGSFSGDNRYEGYYYAMHSAGLEILEDYVQRGVNSLETGYQLAAVLMQLPHPPTAIACVCDILAIGAIRFLIEHGYKPGREIAIAGFDDIALAGFFTPSLTTVAQPIGLIEAQLIEILLAELEGAPLPERQIVLKPTLVIRESTNFILDASRF